MSLIATLQQDMYAAMKAGAKEKATTIRGALSKLKDRTIEKQEELTDQEEMQVLRTLVKQCKEAMDIYARSGRADLRVKEKTEMTILETYLPPMMSSADLEQLITQVIADIGAATLADMGQVMPEIMQRSNGQVDGKMAQQLVREKLQ